MGGLNEYFQTAATQSPGARQQHCKCPIAARLGGLTFLKCQIKIGVTEETFRLFGNPKTRDNNALIVGMLVLLEDFGGGFTCTDPGTAVPRLETGVLFGLKERMDLL